MDYEKEYKKLKGDIKKAYLFAQTDSTKAVLEDILPELKESEDEKIRKEIIQSIKNNMCVIHKDKCLTWLEKQGEHANFRNKIQIGDKVTRNEDGVLVNLSQLNRVAKKDEKQSEQKETLCDKCRREQPSHSCQDIAELGRCALKHQSKQKPTDNAEPKFKKGDWVVYKNEVCQIKHREAGYNLLTNSFGINKEPINERLLSTAHVWSIADAKAGDVLYCKNCGIEYIVMSKGVNENGNIDSYFRYNSVDGFGMDVPSVLSTKDDIIIPATKEQRDLLFQKMKEAGYEWDAEKKELKEIEKESAWSEEDEWKFSDILALLRGGENYRYNTPELFAWLKSIKDKLQPKREWSEEDEKKIMWLVRLISTAGFRELDNDKMPCSRSALLDWLKSLKPKSHWKPSEEQMQILHKFSVPHAVVLEEDAKNLELLYDDLKQL